MSRRSAVALLCATAVCLAARASLAQGEPLVPSRAVVYVAGQEVHFERLATVSGEPVVPISDPGLRSMLGITLARVNWQAGERFAVVTRADGRLITFTIGSDVLSLDGTPVSMALPPFYRNSEFYVPLLSLARALGFGTRDYHGGYVLVPQVLAVQRDVLGDRTQVDISASAPITSRSTIDPKKNVLTLHLLGFGNELADKVYLGGRDAIVAYIEQTGPPGFPTTSVAIRFGRGVKYALHRSADGLKLSVVFARSQDALSRIGRPRPGPLTPAVRVLESPVPAPSPAPSPSATAVTLQGLSSPTIQGAKPSSADQGRPPPQSSPASALPVPTAQPLPEPTDTAGVESPQPGASPSSSPAAEQRITDVAVAQTPQGMRITLTVSGPVDFEWHRLGDPDNRFWVDVQNAVLVGPARNLDSTLSFVKEVKVSQHALAPQKVVRVSVTPTQSIDVQMGPVAGSPNQLGIEIENTNPSPAEPASGFGTLELPSPSPAPSVTYAPTKRDLIVIDPGHGGNDPGAINRGYGLVESKLTLAISRLLRSKLERMGWRVLLTRDGDNEVGDPGGIDKDELQARCDVANAAGARLFVSIHINSSFSSGPNGTTTYYWHPADRAFAQAVQAATVQANGIADAGVKRETFYVIHHTAMPSVLVEVAYLSNPHDATLLQQQAFLDKAASGIARGIFDYSGGPH